MEQDLDFLIMELAKERWISVSEIKEELDKKGLCNEMGFTRDRVQVHCMKLRKWGWLLCSNAEIREHKQGERGYKYRTVVEDTS
jgi:biotin operon repressor